MSAFEGRPVEFSKCKGQSEIRDFLPAKGTIKGPLLNNIAAKKAEIGFISSSHIQREI